MPDPGVEKVGARIEELGLLVGHDYISKHEDESPLVVVAGLHRKVEDEVCVGEMIHYTDVFRNQYHIQDPVLFFEYHTHSEKECAKCRKEKDEQEYRSDSQ